MSASRFVRGLKPDACSKVAPSAKLEWIVASLQRQQGKVQAGWPPPSTCPATPPGGGAGLDVVPSHSKETGCPDLQAEAESEMGPEHPLGPDSSKSSADVVVENTSESPTSDDDPPTVDNLSLVPQANRINKISHQFQKNVSDAEMDERCEPPLSCSLSDAGLVCLTQAQSRPVPSSICRIPKKRGLVLAEDKSKSPPEPDGGSPDASTSNSLASASDFLQKLVQEQKSQVPTLFCRSEDKTCSAKALPNHVPNTKANVNLIQLPKKVDDRLGGGETSQVDSDETSSGKNRFTFQYDSVSSDDEVDSLTTKDASASITKPQLGTPAKAVPTEPASGKLRFYLDGRFVLELTHAAASSSSHSAGWVQSKGKIWTPASEASSSGALRVGISKPTVDAPCPLPQIRPMPINEGLSSVNSPFLLRIGRTVRAIYLCWLTSKELRKAARNPSVDASILYQAALTRNSPIMGMTRMDKNLKAKLPSTKRRRRPLHGVWKELFSNSRSSPCSTSASNVATGCLSEAEYKANHSLLLDALTKPKTRDSSDGCEANSGSSFVSSGIASIPTENEPLSTTSKTLVDKPSTDGYSRSVKNVVSRGCKSSTSAGVSGTKSEHPSMPLLPLPEWYLDPSKAEVPISEMIGYPRPYFPPATATNNPCHIIRKRQQVSSTVQQFSPTNGKRVRLKQEQHMKDCIGKELSPDLTKIGGVKMESCTPEWPSWQAKMEPEETMSSVSGQPISLVCSSRQAESMTPESSVTNIDLAAKVRNAKRFGSFGRGHAVNDAIRTFVISDIVNLGGDVKTHYVPRGVYSEVASRYKIDVSTTTRWWLRHCAEKEQSKRLSSPVSIVPSIKSDPHRPVPEMGDQENSDIKFEVVSERQSPPTMQGLLWESSATSSRTHSIISALTRPMSEPSWSSGLASRHSEESGENPYSISKRSSSMEKVGLVTEDGPLDLRVASKRLRTLEESLKIPANSTVSSRHQLVPSASLRQTSEDYAVSRESLLPVNTRNFVHCISSDHKLGELNVHSIPHCDKIRIKESRLASHEDETNPLVRASRALSTPLQHYRSVTDVCHNGDDSTPSPSSDEVLDVGSHETSSPLSSVTKSVGKTSKIGPAVISAEFPMLSSALKSPLPPSENSGLARKSDAQEHSSHDERTVLTDSTCSEANTTNRDVYTGIGSKFGTRGYPSLPVPPIHPEFPPLAPPPAGLPPWPYPPCPLMAYGPALVNSYYYCCCFLPGCRFHYVYTADGRPVDPREASPSPLVLSDGYSKCFSGVADVSPLMYNSVRNEQVYKNWTSPIPEPQTANDGPSSPCPAREQEAKVPPEDTQNTESTGSMLKDLLLKPSRTTPDRAQPLVTSRKPLADSEKVNTPQHVSMLTFNPVKVEKLSNSHRDQIQRVVSPPVASHSLLSKECSAKLSQPKEMSPNARTNEEEVTTSDLSKAFWESNAFPKSACQPKHFSCQIGTILETEES